MTEELGFSHVTVTYMYEVNGWMSTGRQIQLHPGKNFLSAEMLEKWNLSPQSLFFTSRGHGNNNVGPTMCQELSYVFLLFCDNFDTQKNR